MRVQLFLTVEETLLSEVAHLLEREEVYIIPSHVVIQCLALKDRITVCIHTFSDEIVQLHDCQIAS